MSRVTFQAPVANISGRLSYRSNIVLRTRNGRTQAYIIQNPYKGPVAPQRQRTINAFKEAVNQSKTVLSDPAQRAEYESKYKAHKAFFRRHPRSQNKYYSTFPGFVIAQLAQQINAAAKAAAAAKETQVMQRSPYTEQYMKSCTELHIERYSELRMESRTELCIERRERRNQ